MEPFRVHILGCGSALPTLKHYATSQVVELRGKMFMVDCGEGTQIQLRRKRIGFNKITAVFISHLHGDHCFGIIGLISTFGMLGRTAPLHIYAHADFEPLLAAQMRYFCKGMDYEVIFHKIEPRRRQVVYDDRSLTVETLPLDHRIDCCGFLFREKPTLPHIRRDMIDYYGVPVSQINNIKNGADWSVALGQAVFKSEHKDCEDESSEAVGNAVNAINAANVGNAGGSAIVGDIIPNSRLVTPADKPRAYAYCSDTRYMPTLHEAVRGVDLLYHEATYCEDNAQNSQKYFHSTARQAAMVARDAEVGQLLLGHYSARYDNEEQFLVEAKEIFPRTLLSEEMAVIEV